MREQRQCEADLPFLRHKMREREPNRLKVKTNVCSVLIKSSYTTVLNSYVVWGFSTQCG